MSKFSRKCSVPNIITNVPQLECDQTLLNSIIASEQFHLDMTIVHQLTQYFQIFWQMFHRHTKHLNLMIEFIANITTHHLDWCWYWGDHTSPKLKFPKQLSSFEPNFQYSYKCSSNDETLEFDDWVHRKHTNDQLTTWDVLRWSLSPNCPSIEPHFQYSDKRSRHDETLEFGDWVHRNWPTDHLGWMTDIEDHSSPKLKFPKTICLHLNRTSNILTNVPATVKHLNWLSSLQLTTWDGWVDHPSPTTFPFPLDPKISGEVVQQIPVWM